MPRVQPITWLITADINHDHRANVGFTRFLYRKSLFFLMSALYFLEESHRVQLIPRERSCVSVSCKWSICEGVSLWLITRGLVRELVQGWHPLVWLYLFCCSNGSSFGCREFFSWFLCPLDTYQNGIFVLFISSSLSLLPNTPGSF